MGTGRALIDLTGKQLGYLSVLRLSRKERVPGHGTTTWIYWLCRCVCGREVEVTGNNLRNSQRSCGCMRAESLAAANTKHGHNPGKGCTAEYRAWCKMKERCLNPRDKKYHDYGGRGIRVADEWVKDFSTFLAHIGPRPTPKHSVDRKDVNGNYEPGNVRWATPHEQAANTRKNVYLTANGVTKHRAEWARDLGCRPESITSRIRRGWPVTDAVTVSINKDRKWKYENGV